MAAPLDTNSRLQEFAHPEYLVTTDWLALHLDYPGVKILECDEDRLLYDIGHIPGALRLDWQNDLFNPVTRDFLNGKQFAELMRKLGISQSDTVILYGDRANRWATYALWIFTLFNHRDVRLLDGGRDAWYLEERPSSFDVRSYPTTDYPIVERHDSQSRYYRQDVLDGLGHILLLDTRDRSEYTGTSMGEQLDMLQHTVGRAGHIPTARNIPWNQAVGPDSRFRVHQELHNIYSRVCRLPVDVPITTYSAVGECSAHTWFVLTALLGRQRVYNYDGSWSEWCTSVRLPVTQGSEPGTVPLPQALHTQEPPRRRLRRR